MSFRDEYTIGYVPGNMLDRIEEFAHFYSEHYGEWSTTAPRSGNVTLSANMLRKYLDDNSLVFYARLKKDDSLIGYVIAEQQTVSTDNKMIIWVTQFVVHKDFRNRMVGFDLLLFVWGLSHAYAWGLVTANPYAVRALEKATRRRCDPTVINSHLDDLKDFGESHVWYIDSNTAISVSNSTAVIDTNFLVDHSDIPEKIENVTRDTPWNMGMLPEGHEWLAFVFNEQPMFDYTKSEIEHLLQTSDEITQQAYGKMQMEKQGWTTHTKEEVDYVINKCSLRIDSKILDVGCGYGRHVIELNNKGYDAKGVDYSPVLIEKAKEKAKMNGLNEELFLSFDITSNKLPFKEESFDCVMCLYDVIGSYADDNKNRAILKNIYRLLKKGGLALVSVMNMELTFGSAKHKFVLAESSKPLLDLEPSKTMQNTGEVFNPDYFLIDTEDNVVYRKELFSYPGDRSIASIVRDKRYYMDTISSICLEEGFNVLESSYVKANGWQKTYEYNDKNAKEILLLIQK